MLALGLKFASLALVGASMSLNVMASIRNDNTAVREKLKPITVREDRGMIHFDLPGAEKAASPLRTGSHRAVHRANFSLVVFGHAPEERIERTKDAGFTVSAKALAPNALERIHDEAVVVVNYE